MIKELPGGNHGLRVRLLAQMLTAPGPEPCHHGRGRGRRRFSGEEEPMPQAPARRDTSKASGVAELVRLHHRRRGWAWVAIGSAIGLVLDVAIGVNLTGAAGTLSVIPVFVLLALVVAGLVVVIVDTSRIHRADAAARVHAKGSVSHYPLYAHAYSYPPRHRGSWVFAIVMLAAMAGIAVFILPAEVNSWAYVVGAGNQDTFNPVSYSQACGRRGCITVTDGYLSKSGADVIWGGQVPLGRPFSVRDPLWAWGTGRNLLLSSGDGSAIPTIAGSLFFDGLTLLLVYVLVVIVRDTPGSPKRSQRISAPAGADPGGARRAHHPDRDHHGSGGRRRARRRRGRR